MLSARESTSRKTTSRPKSPQSAARSKRQSPSRRAAPRYECQNRDTSRGERSEMAEPVYRRVVVKLSGEYLAGSQGYGIDQQTVDRIASDLIAAQKQGTEIAVVIG